MTCSGAVGSHASPPSWSAAAHQVASMRKVAVAKISEMSLRADGDGGIAGRREAEPTGELPGRAHGARPPASASPLMAKRRDDHQVGADPRRGDPGREHALRELEADAVVVARRRRTKMTGRVTEGGALEQALTSLRIS